MVASFLLAIVVPAVQPKTLPPLQVEGMPACPEVGAALTAAERELDARYRDQRFKADRAINLSDWETAKNELRILCEMVPDRDDDRYREASGKLVDVEKRMKK